MDILPTIKPLVDTIRKHDKNLADQIQRAATSVVLNHAEADGSDAGNRRARIHTAKRSLAEARRGLLIGAAWGYVARDEVERVDAVLDRVAAMSWRRLHG